MMMKRISFAALAAVVLGSAGAAAAELPGFALGGLPITPHQVAVLGSAGLQEQSTSIAPTLEGMPASPLQIAVLSPRPHTTRQANAADLPGTGVATR